MPYPFWLQRVYYAFVRYKYAILARLPHPDVKKGDRFEALMDFKTGGMTHWNAPFTDGFKCTVPKGTILVAAHDSARLSSGFLARPEKYAEMEEKLVPTDDRNLPKYAGYSLSFPYRFIGRHLKKL